MDAHTAAVYDDLLRFQTELSFDLEQVFFRRSQAWARAQTVLDFGAGNGYYAKRLSEAFPEKQFICVEKNEHLASIAEKWLAGRNAIVVPGSYADVPAELQFDFIIARHVVSYLSDRTQFIEWVRTHSSPKAGALTIDAEDSEFRVHPPLPRLEGGNEKFKDKVKATGGNRDLRLAIDSEWGRVGYAVEHSQVIVVHSDIVSRRHLMHSFMTAVAMFDHGSPLPVEARDELSEWLRNPRSYLQYGLFGTTYALTKEGAK